MISTTPIGSINDVLPGSSMYFKDQSLLLCFQNVANCIKSVDAYYFDKKKKKYIIVWHDEAPDYSIHQVRDIINTTTDDYIIIFNRFDSYNIWRFNVLSNTFTMNNKIMNERQLCYKDKFIYSLRHNNELQIIDLVQNSNNIIPNIQSYGLLQIESQNILQVLDLANQKVLYSIPDFQIMIPLESVQRIFPSQLNLFLKYTNYYQCRKLQITKLSKEYRMYFQRNGQILYWKGSNYTIEDSKIIQIKPRLKVLRCFKFTDVKPEILEKPRYIFRLFSKLDYSGWIYKHYICDVTTAKETKILDRYYIFYQRQFISIAFCALRNKCRKFSETLIFFIAIDGLILGYALLTIELQFRFMHISRIQKDCCQTIWIAIFDLPQSDRLRPSRFRQIYLIILIYMISTTLLGTINGLLPDSRIIFKDQSLLLSFQKLRDGIMSVDAYNFDKNKNQYIIVWHDEAPSYQMHYEDIINTTAEDYLIIFKKYNCYDIWSFNVHSNTFTMNNKIMDEGKLFYTDKFIYSLRHNNELQIIDLVKNSNNIISKIYYYDLLQIESERILQVLDLDNEKVQYSIPDLQRIIPLKEVQRIFPSLSRLFVQSGYSHRRLYITKLTKEYELYFKSSSEYLYCKGSNYIIYESKMIQIKPKQKVLRCLKHSYTKPETSEKPRYIFRLFLKPNISENYIYDLTTAKQTKILDRYFCDVDLNSKTIVEYLSEEGQCRIHKLNIE